MTTAPKFRNSTKSLHFPGFWSKVFGNVTGIKPRTKTTNSAAAFTFLKLQVWAAAESKHSCFEHFALFLYGEENLGLIDR